MRALLVTLIFLAIFAPAYIIKMDYKTKSFKIPKLQIYSVKPVFPTFNITQEQ